MEKNEIVKFLGESLQGNISSKTIKVDDEYMRDEFGSLQTFQERGTYIAGKLGLEFSYMFMGGYYEVTFTRKK